MRAGAPVLSGDQFRGDRFPLAGLADAAWLYPGLRGATGRVKNAREKGDRRHPRVHRTWCMKFSALLGPDPRHWEPRLGPRWHPAEMDVDLGGVQHWAWRAVDEDGPVLDVLMPHDRDTPAAKLLFQRRMGTHEPPDVIHTDKRWSSGAA